VAKLGKSISTIFYRKCRKMQKCFVYRLSHRVSAHRKLCGVRVQRATKPYHVWNYIDRWVYFKIYIWTFYDKIEEIKELTNENWWFIQDWAEETNIYIRINGTPCKCNKLLIISNKNLNKTLCQFIIILFDSFNLTIKNIFNFR
jgi:hypothetical protein